MSENLQLGDVLVFKAEERWVSKAIAMLTDSDVSHAAMYCGDCAMVEMGLSGIMVSKLEIGRGEAAYQLRLNPQLDASALIEAAHGYLAQKTAYDLPALVLLGALLVYRRIRPSTRLYRIVDLILNEAVGLLDRLLNRLLRGGEPGMVCSQLVYQLYQDCGGAYQLHIEGGILENSRGDDVCLLDLRNVDAQELGAFPRQSHPADSESLAQELYMALMQVQPEQERVGLEAADHLAPAVSTFADKLERLAQAAQIPLEALLVTPADLAYHTQNLRRVGEVCVERV